MNMFRIATEVVTFLYITALVITAICTLGLAGGLSRANGLIGLPLWLLGSTFLSVKLLALLFRQERLPKFSLRGLLSFIVWLAIGVSMYIRAIPEIEQTRYKELRAKLWVQVSAKLAELDNFGEPRVEVVANRDLELQSKHARQLRTMYERRLALAERINAAWEEYDKHGANPLEAEEHVYKVLTSVAGDKYYPLIQEDDPRTIVRQALPDVVRWPGLTAGQLQRILRLEEEHPLAARILLVDYAVVGAQEQLAKGRATSPRGKLESRALDRLRQNVYVDDLLGELLLPLNAAP